METFEPANSKWKIDFRLMTLKLHGTENHIRT